MMKKLLIAAALAWPVSTLAQEASRETVIELVGTGTLDAVPSAVTVAFAVRGEGKTEAAAQREAKRREAQLVAALRKEGITADAISELPDSEAMLLSLADSISDGDEDAESDAETPAETPETVTIGKRVRAKDLAQAERVAAIAREAGAMTDQPKVDFTDADRLAARRKVKMLALANARAEAALYAQQLGLQVGPITRISEVGNQTFLPGLQEKVQEAIFAGKSGFEALFTSKPGTQRYETSLVVTFTLQP